MNTLAITLPIFGYILIGWLAAKTGYVTDRVCDGLSEYVFSIAVPALIIITLTQTTSKDPILPTYWVSYFGACAIVWIVTMLVMSKVLKKSYKETALCGFASSQANTIFMGVPLILDVYGEAGSVPLFMLLAIHLPIMMGAATFLVELSNKAGFLKQLKKLSLVLMTNPIFVALIIGGVLHYFTIRPQGATEAILKGIGSTASACALISLGMAITRYKLRDDLTGVIFLTAGKLIIHPLLVWILAFYVFQLPTVYAGVAVLFATMPVGINAYLLATRYGEAEGQISSAVLVSTLLSLFTVSIWLSLLMTME